jgi:uracil phosphoribosyltransferase
MMWIVFISILRAGNGLTAGLFVYCNGTLVVCCEDKMKLMVGKM